MISTSHLHRRSFRFVAFISILQRSLFKIVLRSEIGDVCQDSVRRKSILIYRKFLNKRAGASAFIIGESTSVTTQLIRNISKFSGTDFVTWQRTLRAIANSVHPNFPKILDGQLRSEPFYRTRRGRGRPATRGVTTSSSALADTLEGGESTPGGEGCEDGGRHEQIFSETVPSAVTVPPTDKLIFANGAELERREAYNKQFFSALFLPI